jgi:hypothetical protein
VQYMRRAFPTRAESILSNAEVASEGSSAPIAGWRQGASLAGWPCLLRPIPVTSRTGNGCSSTPKAVSPKLRSSEGGPQLNSASDFSSV